MTFDQPCDHCAGKTEFITQTEPLGAEPGQRVYYCESCKRTTWKSWRTGQQQQQPQKKE